MERRKFVRLGTCVALALLVGAGLLAAMLAGQGSAVLAAQSTTVATPAATVFEGGPTNAFLTMSPQAGFPLDPFVVSLQGGGPLAAAKLSQTCRGYVTDAPSFSIDFQGKAGLIRAFFYSDGDPILVIQAPDGKFICNDNTTSQLLDPTLEIRQPAPGHYNVWVGSARARDLIPGFLVLTTHANIRQGTFGLANLVKRPSLPDIPPVHERVAEAIQRLAQAQAVAQAATTLQPGNSVLTATVTAQGELPAYELTRGITPTQTISLCNGLVNALPDYAFKWVGEAAGLSVYYAGTGDTALAIRTPDGSFACADDADGPRNQNPLVVISKPVTGSYLVWLGRIDPTKPVTGTLTVVPRTGVQPPALKKP